MQQLFQQWLARDLRTGHCVACQARPTCNETEQYCGARCQQHFDALAQMHLGIKRLREAGTAEHDLWDALSNEVVVALLDVSFPLRETDARQFRALARLRQTGERYRALIDVHLYATMRGLPDSVERALTDEALAPFEALERLALNVTYRVPGRGPTIITPRVSEAALLRLTRLTQLRLDSMHERSPVRIWLTALGALPRLTDLELGSYHRNDGDALPAHLCSALTRLSLEYDTSLDPGALTALTELRVLALRHAWRTDDAALARLTTLHTLALYKPYGTADARDYPFSDAGLETLTQLTDLHIEDHQVTARSLGALPSLRRLVLHDNRSVDDAALATLVRLEELQMTMSQRLSLYEGRTGEGLRALPALTSLALAYCSVIEPDAVAPLVQLTHLSLRNQTVSDRALRGLTRIESLRLGSYTTISAEGLRGLRALRQLDLSGNNFVTSASLMGAHEWLPALRELNLDGAVAKSDEPLYRAWRGGPTTRTLRDQLPVGCLVIDAVPSRWENDRIRRAYRVVARVDGEAHIVDLTENADVVVAPDEESDTTSSSSSSEEEDNGDNWSDDDDL